MGAGAQGQSHRDLPDESGRVPHFIAAGGGTIINMSSLAAVSGPNDTRLALGNVPSASYYASKAGIEAFTRYIAGLGRAITSVSTACVLVKF